MKKNILVLLIFMILFRIFGDFSEVFAQDLNNTFLLSISGNHPSEQTGEAFVDGKYRKIRLKAGTKVSISALAKLGHEFIKWQYSDGFLEDPNSKNTFFTMPNKDTNIVAIFTSESTAKNITLTQTSGGKSYIYPNVNQTDSYQQEGNTVRIVAVSDQGYAFEFWEGSQDVVFENKFEANTTFIKTKNQEDKISAIFSKNTDNDDSIENINPENQEEAKYLVSLSSNEGGQAKLLGSDDYFKAGDEVSILAIPDNTYRFDKWQLSFENSNTNNTTLKFIMPQNNVNVNANFVKIANDDTKYNLVINSSFGGKGYIYPRLLSGQIQANTKVFVRAVAASGYKFKSWQSSDVSFEESQNSVTNFIMPSKNLTIYASFEKQNSDNRYNLNIESSEGGKASTVFNGSTSVNVIAGNIIEIQAVPEFGYSFERWETIDGLNISPDLFHKIIKLQMPQENLNIKAIFRPNVMFRK